MEPDIEELYNNVAGEVIVRFETKLSQRLQVDTSKFTLSTEMDQEALQHLICNMLADQLNEEALNKLHFEFLIGGELLRGKVKSHLVRHNISSEGVVDVQYFLAVGTPKETHKTPEEDWISSLAAINDLDENSYAVGLFNGQVSLYTDHVLKLRHSVSTEPIKAIRTLPTPQENQHYLIAGGYSQKLIISRFSTVETDVVQLAECVGSGAAIQSIDVSPLLDGLVCSAAANSISVWRLPENMADGQLSIKKKKKKQHVSSLTIQAEATEAIHDSDILSLIWSSNNQLCSSSMDHSICITDVERLQKSTVIRTGDSVPTSIDTRYDNIISSHEDGYVRLWDQRQPTVCAKKFKSHSKYASCVKFSSSPFVFCSASYDHTVKLWDTRSIFPLETLTTHHDKVFALLWRQKKEIVSGGSDSILAVHSIDNPTV